MSWSAAALRTAIGELLEGTIGSTRVVSSGRFLRGTFEGQPGQASKALELQTSTARHRFDVEVGILRNHPSTPVSMHAPYRICTAEVRVRVTSKLSPSPLRSQRATDIETLLTDCDAAAVALAYRDNIATTNAGASTGIVGGCLREADGLSVPRVELVEQDWQRQTATALITGQAIVKITLSQGTPSGILGADTVLWLEDEFTLNGSNVAAWLNKASGGGSIPQATEALQPAYEATGAPNDRPQVHTSGTTYLLDAVTAWIAAGDPFRCWFVIDSIFDANKVALSVRPMALVCRTAPTRYAWRDGATDQESLVTVDQSEESWHAFEAYRTDSESGIRCNNGSIATVAHATQTALTGLVSIGADTAAGNRVETRLALLVVATGVPSSTQSTQMASYINERFGTDVIPTLTW